jgi:hypothetical protein
MKIKPADLRAAFADIPPLNYKDIHLDNSYDADTRFLKKYNNKHWSEINGEELEFQWECIFFLNKKGLEYVIPKFMEELIIHPSRSEEWFSSLYIVIIKNIKEKYIYDETRRFIVSSILEEAVKRYEE